MGDNYFSSDKESIWEGIDKKMRKGLYGLMHEVLQVNTISPLIYNLLLLIEGLQLAFFAINTSFSFLWTSSATNAIQKAIEYFQINGPIQSNGQTVFLLILYIILSIHVLTLLVMVYCFVVVSNKGKKSSSFFNYIVRYLSYYGVFVNTIGISLSCYSGIYYLHVGLAVFGCILFVLLQTIFHKLYIDINPCSKVPFAQPQSSNGLVKLVIKTALPIYTTFDPEGVQGKAFVVCFAIYMLLLVGYKIMSLPYFSREVQLVSIIIDSCLLWVTWVSFVCAVVNSASISILFFFVGMPFISLSVILLIRMRQSKVLTLTIKNFKSDFELEHYLILLINLIEGRNDAQDSMMLDGAIKHHSRYCMKVQDMNCNCQSLILDRDDEQLGTQNGRSQGMTDSTKRWYMFVQYILIESFEKFQKSSRLHLLHAYIQHGKLSNKFKSLLELMVTSELKPNIQEEFSIFRYTHIIEDEMSESDNRNAENRTIEVNTIVNFQNIYVQFLSQIETSVTFYQEFWNKLIDDQPDVQKLLSLGSRITNSIEMNEELFEEMQIMNPNNIKCLNTYGYYLKDIVNDEQEGLKYLEKAEYVERSNQANKQLIDSEKMKYGENSNTTIVTISGNLNQIGTITNSNNEIINLLGYQKNDIIGQNVNKLMPKVLGNIHDRLLQKYLETSQSTVVGVERIIMCLHKNGYIIPSTLMIKVIPHLDQGIQIVGFLREVEQADNKFKEEKDSVTHYLLYREDNYQVQGISRSIHQYFGIPPSIVYGNSNDTSEFTVDLIAPGIIDIENQTDLKSAQGVVVSIDSTYIQKNFLIDEQEYEDSEYEQHIVQQNSQVGSELDQENNFETTKRFVKFRKAQIKANLISEQVFDDGLKLNVISFVEIDTNSDLKQQEQQVEMEYDQNNLKTTLKQHTTYGKNVDHSQHENENDEHEVDDEGSNISGVSQSEEQRKLKDIKNLISEKTVPKSIKILNRTALLLVLILIAISSYDLGFKVSNESDINSAMNSLQSGYLLPESLNTVIYYVNIVYQIANGLITPPTGQTQTTYANTYISLLSTVADTLQTQFYSMIKYQIQMTNLQSSSSTTRTYTTYQMTSQGTLTTDTEQFQSSLLSFLSSVSSFKAQSLSSMVAGQVNSAATYFYYINSNGLQGQRTACYDISNDFYSFYYDRVGNYKTNYTVVLVIAIIFVVLSLFVLLPIVFQVNRTNNRVLSLFGYIHFKDIKNLSNKCNQFIHDHIYSKENYNLGENESNAEGENQNETKKEEVIDGENNYGSDYIKSIDNGTDQKDTQVPHQDHRKQGMLSQKSLEEKHKQLATIQEKEKKHVEKQSDDPEFNENRSNLLLNQKDNNKRSIVFKFGFVACLFILYYVLHFIFDVQFINNVQTIMYNFQLSSLRPSYTQWVQLYTQQEIQNGGIVYELSTNTDLRSTYHTLLYTLENNIRSYFNYDFPSKLSTYQSLFRNAQTTNICQLMSGIDVTVCSATNSAILQNGFLTSQVSYLEDLRTVSANFLASDLSTASKLSALMATKWQAIKTERPFIVQMMDQLNTQLLSSTSDYLSYRTMVEIIVYSIYIATMLAAFLFIWVPYMARINVKIWRTKGMLNMIPFEVINQNEQLRNAFTSGDILSAVK